MSAGNSQHNFCQRTKEDMAVSRARIINRPVILERNVVRADIMVAPLDIISEII
jgi:hypothetical protein